MDQHTQTTTFFLFTFIVSAAAQLHPAAFGFEKAQGEGDRWIKWFNPSDKVMGGLGMTIAPDGSASFYTSVDNIPLMPLGDHTIFLGMVDRGLEIPVKGWLTNADGPPQTGPAKPDNFNDNRDGSIKEIDSFGDNSVETKGTSKANLDKTNNFGNGPQENVNENQSEGVDPPEKPKERKSIFSRFSPKSIARGVKRFFGGLKRVFGGTGSRAMKGAKVASRLIHNDNSFKDPNGEAVSNWNPGMEVDPQELGTYEHGDVLFPSPDPSLKWPNGIVPYEISPKFSREDYNMIQQAMDEYHRRTCIRWIPRTTETDYVYFNNEHTGCYSFVGRISKRQEINLHSPGCVTKVVTPEHEMMHALGFEHEQSRAMRDNHVTIHLENVKPGRENNFVKTSYHAADSVGVGYDLKSIMHYKFKAFSKNDQPTIVPKAKGVEMEMGERRDSMSETDVLKVNLFYNCNI